MVGEKLFQTNLLSRLSHKVCRLLSSPVLLRKFTKTVICMDPHSPNKLFPTKYCFLILGDEFLFLNHLFIFRFLFFSLFYVILLLLYCFCFFVFRDVPACSGMFRNVPCSGFYRRPERTVFGFVRASSFVHSKKGRKITKVETSIK